MENTGVHISDGALPHLFDAFYREEGSRSRSTGGSGLGLYLVRMILERHGASCAIQNTAEGVRAAVVFPRPPPLDFQPGMAYNRRAVYGFLRGRSQDRR